MLNSDVLFAPKSGVDKALPGESWLERGGGGVVDGRLGQECIRGRKLCLPFLSQGGGC